MMKNNSKLYLGYLLILVIILSGIYKYTFAGIPSGVTPLKQVPDTVSKKDSPPANTGSGALQIDTALNTKPVQTNVPADTVRKIDTALMQKPDENVMTNTKLFTYILLTVLGLGLFFFIFVINLFKTFHRKKSTRQSLLLSWSLFFTVSIIWIFIIWGLIAEFWTAMSFMIIVIFLFIISLIMTIIALKSK